MSRPYTGNKDGAARGKRPGLEGLVAAIQTASGGKLWNNGTYGVRNMRGKGALSVHATGRAADISRRKMDARRPGCSRADVELVMDWLISNADAIGLEFLADYEPGPGGRGWKCDREAWKDWKRGEVSGAPGGDWIHIELSPATADSTDWIAGVMASFPLGADTPAPAPAPAPESSSSKPYPGTSTKLGSKATARVREIQQRLADLGAKNSAGTAPLVVDGDFSRATDAAVRAFQSAAGLTVDGIVGPKSWAALFG
jgi:murein L,D-transpeptidase YcbB/YkuD